MVANKACKVCKTIYTGQKCPKCGSDEASMSFKGKITVLNAEESEIAKKIDKKEKGTYALKV